MKGFLIWTTGSGHGYYGERSDAKGDCSSYIATAQRKADENARSAHQQEWENAQAQAWGLNVFTRQEPTKFMGDADPDKTDL